jgi:hypothetical protein
LASDTTIVAKFRNIKYTAPAAATKAAATIHRLRQDNNLTMALENQQKGPFQMGK